MNDAQKELCSKLEAPSYTADDYMVMSEAANEIGYLAGRLKALERAALTSPAKVGGDERDSVIAGALFDFLGYLTSRDEVLTLSAAHLATPSADALKTWAEKRGLRLDGANVMNWQARAALSADGGSGGEK